MTPFERLVTKRREILSPETEAQLIAKAKSGNGAARNRLVSAHLQLIVQTANRYRFEGMELADLVSHGVVGFCKAVDRFDPSRKVKLTTYAVWWVRAEIGMAGARRHLVFRPTSSVQKARHALRAALSPEEREDCAARVRAVDSREISLSEGVCHRASGDQVDIEEYPPPALVASATPEDAASLSEQKAHAKRLLWRARLTPRERHVIERRILTDEKETLQHIADVMGLSRARIGQIEAKALKKLRAAHAESEPAAA